MKEVGTKRDCQSLILYHVYQIRLAPVGEMLLGNIPPMCWPATHRWLRRLLYQKDSWAPACMGGCITLKRMSPTKVGLAGKRQDVNHGQDRLGMRGQKTGGEWGLLVTELTAGVHQLLCQVHHVDALAHGRHAHRHQAMVRPAPD